MSAEQPDRKSTDDHRERQADDNLRLRRGIALLGLVVFMLVAGGLLIVILYPVLAKWFDW